MARTARVTGAQLAQQRDEGVADQGVDLVEQQHQRLVELGAPAGQKALQGRGGRAVGEHVTRQGCRGAVAPEDSRPTRDRRHDDLHRPLDILAQRLGRLEVGIDGTILAPRIEHIGQCQQTGGLAGLSRGMEQKVLLLGDQIQDLLEIEARQGWQAVMLAAIHRALGVEEAHGNRPESWQRAHAETLRRANPIRKARCGSWVGRNRCSR